MAEFVPRRPASGNADQKLMDAGRPSDRLLLTTPDGLREARLQAELKRANDHIADLEKGFLDAAKIRELIGAVDTTALGQASDWLKGPRKRITSTTGIPVLFLSDIHFDEVVRPEQINNSNAYNREIATKRIQYTFTTCVELLKSCMTATRYDGIVLALGGDLLSGNIHDELSESNEDSILRSVFVLANLLIEGIKLLADEFKKVFIPCVVGNHGRMHHKPRAKNKVWENYEYLIYHFLSKHFSGDDRISFFIPDGPDAVFSIYEKTICLTHGDQFQGGSGIAGIFSPLMLGMARKQRQKQAMKLPFSLMMCGHFHQLIMTEQLIINGSVKGYDEYANDKNFPFERPQQACFVIHPEHGLTFRMPVVCSGYEETAKPKQQLAVAWA